eukprot:1545690-Prymnesium_polylepis.1
MAFLSLLPVRLIPPLSRGIKEHVQADTQQPRRQLLRIIMCHGMAGDCDALAACSGERQRRGVYLWRMETSCPKSVP